MLRISEMFYSLQGEGVSRGTPAVFIRFPGCNLMCKGTDWVCDSLKLRNVYKEYFDMKEFWTELMSFHYNMKEMLQMQRIHLVITGGEPGLAENSEAAMQMLFYLYKKLDEFYPYVEVETNGSLDLNPSYRQLLDRADQINCSPKLASSGNLLDLRRNTETLNFMASRGHAYFKFVVSGQADLDEIIELQDLAKIPSDRILVMPCTNNVGSESTMDLNKFVWQAACDHCWLYTARDHINVWGLREGV